MQGHVTGPYDPSKPADVGHFLVAIKPDLFMEMGEFKARMQHLYDRVVGSDKMPGVERIYFPGELEQECAKVSRGRLGHRRVLVQPLWPGSRDHRNTLGTRRSRCDERRGGSRRRTSYRHQGGEVKRQARREKICIVLAMLHDTLRSDSMKSYPKK